MNKNRKSIGLNLQKDVLSIPSALPCGYALYPFLSRLVLILKNRISQERLVELTSLLQSCNFLGFSMKNFITTSFIDLLIFQVYLGASDHFQ